MTFSVCKVNSFRFWKGYKAIICITFSLKLLLNNLKNNNIVIFLSKIELFSSGAKFPNEMEDI